jgi:hypothetical protein
MLKINDKIIEFIKEIKEFIMTNFNSVCFNDYLKYNLDA